MTSRTSSFRSNSSCGAKASRCSWRGDGEVALQMVAEHHPDLVLLDVMMPKRNGYEVCQRMRERPEWRGIKIVMLSAKGRDVEVSKGVSLGADLYVTKPFSNAELVAQINALLAPA